MLASHHYTRINTSELKELMYERIGHERGEKYFNLLKKFLSSKLSKVDFDKSCIQTIGRENLSLHNRLIRSIIKNACQAKTPPQKDRKVEPLGVNVANVCPRNNLQSLYGDAFPHSPRKCRSPISRDRKFRERPSPLGPLGKSPSITYEETVSRTQEQSAAELVTLSGRPPMGTSSVEDGEEVEQFAVNSSSWRWSSIAAPLGISLNLDGARKAPFHSSSLYDNVSDSCKINGELPDTRSLGRRLQKKLALEGAGITLDCANLLNNSIDVFMKGVISQYGGIAGSRLAEQSTSQTSLLDFRVALESNPSIIGADWPTQLEKMFNYTLQ